jgi:raffinose/stachyose/melibiose transport system permease protein
VNNRRYGKSNLIIEVVMILVALIFLFPLYVLLNISLKPLDEVADSPLGLPKEFSLANYREAWAEASLGSALINSTVVMLISVVLLIFIGSMAAYALARRQSRLSYGLYLLFLLGIILPFQLALIPLYQLMRDLQLLGTYTSLIIFYTGHQLPFTVFLYTGFLRALPRDYEDAAFIDGASHFQAFRKIIFPLLRPVTGTVVILNAIFVWNDFLTPLLYVGGTPLQTLPVAIYSFVGQYVSQWGLVFAGLVIGIMPILIVYFLLQRYIIRGFASGLKG